MLCLPPLLRLLLTSDGRGNFCNGLRSKGAGEGYNPALSCAQNIQLYALSAASGGLCLHKIAH